MYLTIERMRTLVLVAGILLVVALAAFLGVARWKSRFNVREIPKRLGINIQQEANGVTYTQSRGGHTAIRIHASKAVQLKQGGRLILHDVQIELNEEDGSRVDRIAGNEFEYDQKNGMATAQGPVEITLMRPGAAPAVAPKATLGHVPPKPTPLSSAAERASQGEIHVKTSGLTFDQKTGIATTAQRVEFAIAQGSGSSMGAIFDSDKGTLVLDHSVELSVRRGPENVLLHAMHAEFERETLLCRMHGVNGSFREGKATAGDASLLFRQDGSAMRLDATNGFSMASATADHVSAPTGRLEFDQHNQPTHGRLDGGATMDSSGNERKVHGYAPSADLTFTAQGLLRRVHLERGVSIHSDESSQEQPNGEAVRVARDWRSPVADLDFHSAPGPGRAQVELASVTGSDGVVIKGETQRPGAAVLPSRMAADKVTASFGDRQVLTAAVGTGHASLEQTAASGARQVTSGDRIEASFVPPSGGGTSNGTRQAVAQIQSATIDGNVLLVQQPVSKPGASAQDPLRATAGRALYEGAGERLHLTIHPRVEDGGLQLTADKVDVSQGSGDAFAHGNVKATWLQAGSVRNAKQDGSTADRTVTLGGQGPTHVIAAEAQLHQATQEVTFHGQARMWQDANSVWAPVIVLDRIRQTLVAHGPADPVRVVMVSAEGARAKPGANSAKIGQTKASGNDASPTLSSSSAIRREKTGRAEPASSAPSVIRLRGGDLKYSEAARRAVMHGGATGHVVAETASGTSVSDSLELDLLPPGNHAGKDGSAAEVDRMTASGHVTLSSEGRRGTGERLVYTSERREYVLTGTVAAPPRLTDPVRGAVSGEALIFNTLDDSVSIEGGGRKTSTETTAPKAVAPK